MQESQSTICCILTYSVFLPNSHHYLAFNRKIIHKITHTQLWGFFPMSYAYLIRMKFFVVLFSSSAFFPVPSPADVLCVLISCLVVSFITVFFSSYLLML